MNWYNIRWKFFYIKILILIPMKTSFGGLLGLIFRNESGMVYENQPIKPIFLAWWDVRWERKAVFDLITEFFIK